MPSSSSPWADDLSDIFQYGLSPPAPLIFHLALLFFCSEASGISRLASAKQYLFLGANTFLPHCLALFFALAVLFPAFPQSRSLFVTFYLMRLPPLNSPFYPSPPPLPSPPTRNNPFPACDPPPPVLSCGPLFGWTFPFTMPFSLQPTCRDDLMWSADTNIGFLFLPLPGSSL